MIGETLTPFSLRFALIGSSAAESSTFQDSFQSSPSAESRTTTAKKKPLKKASDTEIQQHPLEIRFVMTEKDGQGRLKNRKQPLSPPPQTLSPSLDTQGDTAADQEAQESSPTPDFERNADGKYVALVRLAPNMRLLL